MSEESNPIMGYADTYRTMARQGKQTVEIWSVITDLERNMAPLMTTAQAELAALREELATERLRADVAVADANDAERRNAASEHLLMMWYSENALGRINVDDSAYHVVTATAEHFDTKTTESGASEPKFPQGHFKCLACGGLHPGNGNLPCPKMSPISGASE